MTRLYQVEVSMRGQTIAEYTVEALDALTAINLVEAEYGEPPQVGDKTVHGCDKNSILNITCKRVKLAFLQGTKE